MPLAPTVRFRPALVLGALLLAASPAQAELVTHQFTGQVTTITNGANNSLDLTGIFSMGQASTLDYTIERDTPPVQVDPYTSSYTDAITALAFSVGGWSGSGTPGYSFTAVLNDIPSPGLKIPGIQAAPYDQYTAQVQGGVTAPDIGGASFQTLTYTFDDVNATAFNSTAIPRVFPDIAAFEGKTLTILFFDFTQLKSGYIMVTLGGVTTPARAATWGGVKALYR